MRVTLRLRGSSVVLRRRWPAASVFALDATRATRLCFVAFFAPENVFSGAI
jgi:hypothetical protein